MLVAKICLTGGPCGGKTTALAKIEREFTDMGYKVFIINEIATRFINSGVKPFGEDNISMIDFEDILLKQQLVEEESFEKVAKLLNKKCIILCDRGVFDIKSFLSNRQFDGLLNKYNLSKLKLMDNYDMVIHLNTVAKGAPQFYTTENNKARKEGIKEAIIRDDMCQEAWSFHNNFKVVDNSTDFENKVQRVINTIKEYFKTPVRKERKYLVTLKPDAKEELDKKQVVTLKIKQTYLSTDKDCEIRLRKRTLGKDSTYYITVKKNNYGKNKVIVEEKIDKNVYERLLEQRMIINEVNKERTCFVYEESIYKLDYFEDGTYVLEAFDGAKIPPFINVIKDVTYDDAYYNINIKNHRACLTKEHI